MSTTGEGLRYSQAQQLESLHSRYTGTGHADIGKFEWVAHHHRDTYATIIGLPSLLSYAAMADGEAPQRVKFEYCERMLAPIGPPPETED